MCVFIYLFVCLLKKKISCIFKGPFALVQNKRFWRNKKHFSKKKLKKFLIYIDIEEKKLKKKRVLENWKCFWRKNLKTFFLRKIKREFFKKQFWRKIWKRKGFVFEKRNGVERFWEKKNFWKSFGCWKEKNLENIFWKKN